MEFYHFFMITAASMGVAAILIIMLQLQKLIKIIESQEE